KGGRTDKACGLSGSIDERIDDCQTEVGPMVLVHRGKSDFFEIWKDTRSGAYWSDVLVKEMGQVKAWEACRSAKFAGLNIKWRLPNIYHYRSANGRGELFSALFNLRKLNHGRSEGLTFWT